MENLTQKVVCQLLDGAAARAEVVDATPSTGKQCWFLAKLILQAQDEQTYSEFVTNISLVLTKQRASFLISNYLN